MRCQLQGLVCLDGWKLEPTDCIRLTIIGRFCLASIFETVAQLKESFANQHGFNNCRFIFMGVPAQSNVNQFVLRRREDNFLVSKEATFPRRAGSFGRHMEVFHMLSILLGRVALRPHRKEEYIFVQCLIFLLKLLNQTCSFGGDDRVSISFRKLAQCLQNPNNNNNSSNNNNQVVRARERWDGFPTVVFQSIQMTNLLGTFKVFGLFVG